MRRPMEHGPAGRGRSWAAAAVAVLVLAVAAPRPGSALHQLTDVSSATDPFAPLVAAVTLVAWAAALWLALSVLVTVAGDCPGWTGRIGRALSRRLVPAAMRRTLQLTLGLTMAVSALGATTASASAPAPPAPSSSEATSGPAGPGNPSLDWPTVRAGAPGPGPAGTSSAAPTSVSSPSPIAGAQAAAAQVAAAQADAAQADAAQAAAGEPAPAAASRSTALPVPSTEPAAAPPEQDRAALPTASAATTRPAPAATSGGSVSVRPGDSLWSISRAHLRAAGADASPADVARAWPQWWEANRQLVGDDPDLVLPGAQLTPP